MATDHRIVGLGEILWDMLPSGKELGGAPANFAYHAQCLGAHASVVSCVGSDLLGEEILARLDDANLDRTHVTVDPTRPTGTVSVTLGEGGIPSYVIHREVAWDYIPWSEDLKALAREASAACFGSLGQRSDVSRETILRFLRAMPADSLRVFDVNLRQSFYSREIIHESCLLSSAVKLNDEELPILADMLRLRSQSTEDQLRELISTYSLRLIALTRGANGSLLCTPEEIDEHPGHQTTIEDTIGAGDSFTAAITVGTLNGDNLAQINDTANKLAAYVCSQKGAMPKASGVRSWV